MELSVLTYMGKETGRKLTLPSAIFDMKPNDHAIYLDVKNILANQRQGTHKSKERGEIAGSTRKIKKQKGTGTARAGSIKSPLFRGGGRVFGPRPRDYSFKLNKKMKSLARKSTLTYKARQGAITLLEDFSFPGPKTRLCIDMLRQLGITEKKILLVLPNTDKNVVLSSRNIPNLVVILAGQINTYDVLNAKRVLISEMALEKISTTLL